MVLPSELIATEKIKSVCPSSFAISRPVTISQILQEDQTTQILHGWHVEWKHYSSYMDGMYRRSIVHGK